MLLLRSLSAFCPKKLVLDGAGSIPYSFRIEQIAAKQSSIEKSDTDNPVYMNSESIASGGVFVLEA